MIANPDCANEVRANGSFHPFPAGWSKQSIMPSAGDGSVGRWLVAGFYARVGWSTVDQRPGAATTSPESTFGENCAPQAARRSILLSALWFRDETFRLPQTFGALLFA
jgi:hypothetical protein